ncbi:MAG: hypothetical protein AAF604_13065 [Acidobacteriota bacterium]
MMPVTVVDFLALLLVHGMVAFLRPSATPSNGLRGVAGAALLRFLLSVLVLTLFTANDPRLLRFQLVLLTAVGAHAVVDLVSRRRLAKTGPRAFLLVQSVHGVLVLVSALMLDSAPGDRLAELLALSRDQGPALLLAAAIYALVIFGGGHLIALVLAPFAAQLDLPTAEGRGLILAGRYIGWLERFLLLTAVVADWPATFGLVLAAKSVFRFPELKEHGRDRGFAEYFLIGTLLSVALAAAGGLALARLPIWLAVGP